MTTKFFLIVIGVMGLSSILKSSPLNTEKLRIEQKQNTYRVHSDGFMQTPIGGQPGTSDLKRPTLAELGIKNIRIGEQVTQIYWKNFIFYLGYQRIQPKSRGYLSQTLRTYGNTILASTFLETSNRFDCYRIGIAMPVALTHKIKFTPKFEFLVLNFDYHFKTAKLDKHRGYRHLTVRAGKQLAYQATPQLVVNVEKLQSLPLADTLNVLTTEVGISHQTLNLAITQHQQNLEFEDGQALPNHIVLNTRAVILSKN